MEYQDCKDTIERIVKIGGHQHYILSYGDVTDIIRCMTNKAMMDSGLNQATGYDGVETNEDLILWLNTLLENVPKIL